MINYRYDNDNEKNWIILKSTKKGIETDKKKNRSPQQEEEKKMDSIKNKLKSIIKMEKLEKKRKMMMGMDKWFTWRSYERREKMRVKKKYDLFFFTTKKDEGKIRIHFADQIG